MAKCHKTKKGLKYANVNLTFLRKNKVTSGSLQLKILEDSEEISASLSHLLSLQTRIEKTANIEQELY